MEILCTHAIVDRNKGVVSTPRFTVYVAGDIVAKKREELKQSFSPIFKNDDLAESRDISAIEHVGLLEEEKKHEVEVQKSNVVQSMFGEDAEEGVSVIVDNSLEVVGEDNE